MTTTTTTLLFFDDWCLETHQNIERKMGKPKWVEEADFITPEVDYQDNDRSCYYPNVFWDDKMGLWRAFYLNWSWKKLGPGVASLVTAESKDGLHWTVPDFSEKFQHKDRLWKNEVFIDGRGTEPGTVFIDQNETDPARRYKLMTLPGSYTEYVAGRGVHRLAVSADGYEWKYVEGVEWGDWLTDTANFTYYNQHRGSYVTVVRPTWGDRRVALMETRDWKHWSSPEVVVGPDPLDPPGLQYYSMPVVPYEGMYIGLLWAYHCNLQEIRGDKRQGPIDGHLTYSYDGWHFNKTFREAFVPLNEPGLTGCGSVYPSTVCVDQDNVIRIYSNEWKTEHHLHRDDRNLVSGMMLHTLRLDGFMYLESTMSIGSVMTRLMVFSEPELKINIQCPSGDARVQISDDSGKPLEGFSFDDCVPFTGDDLFWEPQWTSGKSLSDVLRQPVRIEVQMYRGRLFAIRGGFYKPTLMQRMRKEF